MTVADPSAVKVPVVALKLAEDPDVTATVAGTLRALLLLPTVNVMPPAGTFADRDAMQELPALDPRLAGLQTSEETVTG